MKPRLSVSALAGMLAPWFVFLPMIRDGVGFRVAMISLIVGAMPGFLIGLLAAGAMRRAPVALRSTRVRLGTSMGVVGTVLAAVIYVLVRYRLGGSTPFQDPVFDAAALLWLTFLAMVIGAIVGRTAEVDVHPDPSSPDPSSPEGSGLSGT